MLTRFTTRMRQAICALRGHDALLHFDTDRLSLLCTSCGYQSPGWEVKNTIRREPAPLQARRAVRLSLVSERRVA